MDRFVSDIAEIGQHPYVLLILLTALAFDFINGFHDAANSIATIVGTRVLRPMAAVVWAAWWNFVAAWFFGVHVANTVAKMVHTDFVNEDVIFAGLIGAISWNLFTWFFGLPTSSSHALLGGFGGAAMAYAGKATGVLHYERFITTVQFIVLSPLVGMLLALLFVTILLWLLRKSLPAKVDRYFRIMQLGSAAAFSLGHGTNDAQKTMGIIAALLYAGMWKNQQGEFEAGHVDFPFWIVLACHLAIGLGTLAGGWRIVKTMGLRIVKLKPYSGALRRNGRRRGALHHGRAGHPRQHDAHDHRGHYRRGGRAAVFGRPLGRGTARRLGLGDDDPPVGDRGGDFVRSHCPHQRSVLNHVRNHLAIATMALGLGPLGAHVSEVRGPLSGWPGGRGGSLIDLSSPAGSAAVGHESCSWRAGGRRVSWPRRCSLNAGGFRMRALRLCGCVGLALLGLWTTPGLAAEPSIGWRFDGSGRYTAAEPPRDWSAEKNVLWKSAPLGRSISTPVVLGDRVFTTADPAELVCLRASDGQPLWQRPHTYADALGAEKAAEIAADHRQAESLRKEADDLRRQREERKKAGEDREDLKSLDDKIADFDSQIRALHAYPPMPGGDTGNSASTPATDGQAIYAVFGTGIVSAHTLDGQRRWMKFIAAPSGSHSASPLLVDGRLIVSLGELFALDPTTGDIVWRAKVPERHGSPVAARLADGSVIVTPDGAVVRASDGRVLAKDQFRLGYCSPIVSDGVIYAVQDGTIKALKLPESSVEPFALEKLWESKGARTNRLASPVVHDGLLYSVTEQGILEVFDAASGAAVYQKRLSLRKGAPTPACAWPAIGSSPAPTTARRW